MIHTGLPRHSTVIIWPGASLLISASTGAPADLARSDGAKLARNGTAAATPATPPTVAVATISRRRPQSTFSSQLMIGSLKVQKRTARKAGDYTEADTGIKASVR